MSTLTQHYIIHLDAILTMYDDAPKDEYGFIPDSIAYGLIARTRGAVEKISGRRSSYTRQMLSILDKDWNPPYKAQLITGVVLALKGDIENGYLASLSALVHGEVFEDFLQMAIYLLKEGFKDAAAVIAGSTLEAHIRQLCLQHGVDTEYVSPDGSTRPKKASQLNQDLGKTVYTLFDQKQVTAWLDLRNSAAHGNYNDYSEVQVEQFLDWLQDFIGRYPA